MRLLVVPLCALALPSLARADAAGDAAIEAVKKPGGRVEDGGKVVDLSRTRVTDAGLRELAALKGLTDLDLGGTKVTDAAARGFERGHPGCRVYR